MAGRSWSLERGDLLPELCRPLPGEKATAMAARLASAEAPGVNTLVEGATDMVWLEALGSNVLDVDGNRYLDLTAGFGVAAIGHRHPAVAAAVGRQAERLVHGLGDVYAHPVRVELAERLSRFAPLPEARVYFAVSGADAVEIALKTGHLWSRRPEVLAFEPAYHGATLAAVSASSRPAFRRPFDTPLESIVHRLPHGAPAAEIKAVLRRRPGIGLTIVEPVVGREATRWPPSGWLAELSEVCRRHEILLAVDEIFTGFGRCGAWFVCEAEGVEPDLVCCGKALGGGLPIAAAVGRSEVMECWRTDGEARHTATFVAHPLACAAALAALDVLEGEGLVDRALRMGQLLSGLLGPLADIPVVVDVRGRGLLWGVELSSPAAARQLGRTLLERGVIALAGGANGTVLQIAPPLVITERQLEFAAGALVESATETAAAPSERG